MPMQMGFRWYGEGNDRISLSDIRQIPGVSTIVWALHDKLDLAAGRNQNSCRSDRSGRLQRRCRGIRQRP